MCIIINERQTNGIYYNSDTKQAELRAQTTYDGYGYYPEMVLYFPQDGTTYAVDLYFDRAPFTDLQYTVEDLVNAYIRLSYWLYDEVIIHKMVTQRIIFSYFQQFAVQPIDIRRTRRKE